MVMQHDMVLMTDYDTDRGVMIDSNLVGYVFDREDHREIVLKAGNIPESTDEVETFEVFFVRETLSEIMVLLQGVRLQSAAEIKRAQALKDRKTALPCSGVGAREVEAETIPEYSGPKLYYSFGSMKKGYSLRLSTESFTMDDSPTLTKELLKEVAHQIFGVIPGEEVSINAVEDNVHYVENDLTRFALETHFEDLGWESCDDPELEETETESRI